MSIGLNGGRDDVLPLLSVCSYSYLRKIIDLVIYSDIARVISLRIIIINPYVSWRYLNLSHMSNATIVTKKQNIDVVE